MSHCQHNSLIRCRDCTHDDWRACAKRAEAALTKINAIRNSIVGAQAFNWSEHAYPLVAALNEAGFAGLPYPEARENVGTLLARAERAEAEVARLREVLRFYADAPRDEDGATMPLDMGERARAALADSEKEET